MGATLTVPANLPPRTLTIDVAGVPKELRDRDQWLCWRWEEAEDKQGNRKWTKVPVNARTGALASTTDPETWTPISVALYWLDKHRDRVDGIGYVFAEDDPYCGIDLDKARDPETGRLAAWAQAIVDRFDSFTEWSITGTGAHIYIVGTLPVQKSREKGQPIEVYDRGRFFVVSGQPIGNPGSIGDRNDELADWHRETFPKAYAPKPQPRPASTEPLSVDDDALLQACMGNEKFRRLHAGDDGDYPDGNGGTDTSAADQGYCNILYRNGGSRAQLEDFLRRFRYREKLDKHRTYVAMTVETAFDGTIERYQPAPRIVTHERPIARSATLPGDLPNDVAALKAMICELHANNADAGEIERLRDDLAEARRTISGMVQVFLHPYMAQSEKIALIGALNLAEQNRQKGKVRSDGSVELTSAEIADDWRAEPEPGEAKQPTNRDGTKPRMTRQHVKPIMETLVERGFVQATPRSVTRARANGSRFSETVWDITPPERLSDALAVAATWKPTEPKVRKARTRDLTCPHCGEVHAIKRQDFCTGCGELRAERTITPAEQETRSETDELHDLDPVAADDTPHVPKNSGHRETVVVPHVPKNSGQGRAPLSLVAHARNGRSNPPPTASPPAQASPPVDWGVPF